MPPVPGSFATRWNLDYLDELYNQWKADPHSVDEHVALFCEGLELGLEQPLKEDGAASTTTASAAPANPATQRIVAGDLKMGAPGRYEQQQLDQLVYAYRDLGHTICNLDPIGFNNNTENQELDLASFGFEDTHLDLEFATSSISGLGDKTTLRGIVDYLRDTTAERWHQNTCISPTPSIGCTCSSALKPIAINLN